MIKLFILIFLLSFSTHAYEEVFINAVSTTKKTFVTRTGKRKGIYPGHKGVFISDNLSLIATASEVTGEFTVWVLDSPTATVPFINGQIVTYHDAKEYAWTLMDLNKEMKLKRLQMKEPQWGFNILGGYSRALSESVTGVNPTNATTTRNSGIFEIYLNHEIARAFEWGFGLRYEKEVIVSDFATLYSNRIMALVNVMYTFPILPDFFDAQIYGGLTGGLGRSTTNTDETSQTGKASLLPSYRMGIKLPITDEYLFLAEGALDSLSTTEVQSTGQTQNTNQNNARFMMGVKAYVDI